MAAVAAAAAGLVLVLLLLCRASGEPPRDGGGERGAASPRTPRGAAADASAALQAENVAPRCRRPLRWLGRRPSAEGCPPVPADGAGSTSAAPAAVAAPPLATCEDSSSASASLERAAAVATPPFSTAGSGAAGTWLPTALLDGSSSAGILVLVRCRTTLPRWMACTFAAASALLGRCERVEHAVGPRQG